MPNLKIGPQRRGRSRADHFRVISEIAWLDFSDQQRRKMMEVVALFKEQDTRDELGLGSIRRLAPATSSSSPGSTLTLRKGGCPQRGSQGGCGRMNSA